MENSRCCLVKESKCLIIFNLEPWMKTQFILTFMQRHIHFTPVEAKFASFCCLVKGHGPFDSFDSFVFQKNALLFFVPNFPHFSTHPPLFPLLRQLLNRADHHFPKFYLGTFGLQGDLAFIYGAVEAVIDHLAIHPYFHVSV
jgi:hypothetical protein